MELIQIVTALLLAVSIAVLIVNVFRLLAGRSRREGRRCARCGYARSETSIGLCPECGHERTIEKGLTQQQRRRVAKLCAVSAALVGLLFVIEWTKDPYGNLPNQVVFGLMPDDFNKSDDRFFKEATERVEDGWIRDRAPTDSQLGSYFSAALMARHDDGQLVRQWEKTGEGWKLAISIAHHPAVSSLCWLVVLSPDGEVIGEDVVWPWFLVRFPVPIGEFELFAKDRPQMPDSVFELDEPVDQITLQLFRALEPSWPTDDGKVPDDVRQAGPFCELELNLPTP